MVGAHVLLDQFPVLEHAVANVAVKPLVLLAAVIGAGTAVNLLESFGLVDV